MPTLEATNHLLCYEINPRNIPATIAHLLNQFGYQNGVVTVNNEVCVPSTKIATLEEEILPGLRAFLSTTTTSGNIVAAANSLPGDNVLSYDCSSDAYVGGPFVNNNGVSGVNAADCLCRERASSQNLLCQNGGFGCWKAWIADSNALSQPASRFTMAIQNSTQPILQVDVNGAPDPTAPLAVGGFQDLVVCGNALPDPEGGNAALCLDDPLIGPAPAGDTMRDESGSRSVGATLVFTNVTPAGTVIGNAHCGDWASSALSPASIGNANSRLTGTDGWTQDTDMVDICLSSRRLYCFEDELGTLP